MPRFLVRFACGVCVVRVVRDELHMVVECPYAAVPQLHQRMLPPTPAHNACLIPMNQQDGGWVSCVPVSSSQMRGSPVWLPSKGVLRACAQRRRDIPSDGLAMTMLLNMMVPGP